MTLDVADREDEEPRRCPHCGASVIKYGWRKANYRDLPINGRPVVLAWRRRRFQCSNLHAAIGRAQCGRIFSSSNEAMDDKRAMTARLVEYIGNQSLARPFFVIAKEVGVDDQTIRQAFADWSARNTVSTGKVQVPRNLAIVSIDILKKPRPVLADVDQETVLDILPNQDEHKLLISLGEMKNPEGVEIVVVDLYDEYIEAAHEAFPKVTVAINLDHLRCVFDEAFASNLAAIRRSLPDRQKRAVLNDKSIMKTPMRSLGSEQRAVLEYWFKRLPHLKSLFQMREKFLDFLEADDRADAGLALDLWQGLEGEFQGTELERLWPMIAQRRHEVLNSFDVRTSKSFGHIVSALQDVLGSDSNGQAFDVRRAKVLSSRAKAPTEDLTAGEALPRAVTERHGVHIPTFLAGLKSSETSAE